MFGCLGVWVFGCLGVWVFGCLGVWVFGCLGVWVFGCLGVCGGGIETSGVNIQPPLVSGYDANPRLKETPWSSLQKARVLAEGPPPQLPNHPSRLQTTN